MGKTRLPFTLFLLLLGCPNAYCQELFEEEAPEKIRVHLAPLNFFDPVTAVFQVGVQKRLNERFSLSIDHGFKSQAVQKLMERQNSRLDHRYSKAKVELKYFLGIKNPGIWSRDFPYLSIEGMYFPQAYRKENDWIHREGASYLYESSHIKRPVWVASLKYGRETRYRKVTIDKFVGIGVRHLSIRHHQTLGAVEELYYEDAHSFFPPLDRQEGTFWKVHISLGVKFGFPFE